MQAGESAQSPITAFADEYDDGLSELEAIEAELEALYDSRVCTFLVSLLSSASASTRVLAGATYLLAMMTAGKGSNAEEWRTQMVKGCGILRLVALLSAQSSSVCFNALLVLVNFLRHCPVSHKEMLRLGALRKFALLLDEAEDEPQQNLCADAFECLCKSEMEVMPGELLQTGCTAKIVSWLGCASSDRVAGKVLKSLAGLVERDGASDTNLAMGLQIAGPLMALVRGAGSTSLRAAALEALATICASTEHGQRHREECRVQGCVLLLVGLLESANDRETLVQVLNSLAVLAALDPRCREEIINSSCQYQLQRFVRPPGLTSPRKSYAAVIKEEKKEDDFAVVEVDETLVGEEHAALVHFLLQLCSTKRPLHFPECRDKVSSPAKVGAKIAARVGAD